MSDRVSQADRGALARKLVGEGPEPFFSHYWPRLLHFLTPLIQSSDYRLAEDAAQVAFERACDNWDMLQFRCDRPDSWLFKVAIRELRSQEAQDRAGGRLHEDFDRVAAEADLRAAAATDDWLANHLSLIAAIQVLPRREGEVIALALLDFTPQETAEILGVANGTVRCQLSLAAAKLRVLLSEAESAPRRNTV